MFDNIFAKLIKDKNGKYMYLLPKEKGAYVVPDEQLRKANVLTNRLFVALAAAVGIHTLLYIDIIPTVVAAILIYFGLNYYLKKKFLPSLSFIPNYKFVNNAGELTRDELVKIKLRAALFLVLGLVLIATVFFDTNELYVKAMIVAVGLGAVFISYRLFKSTKQKS